MLHGWWLWAAQWQERVLGPLPRGCLRVSKLAALSLSRRRDSSRLRAANKLFFRAQRFREEGERPRVPRGASYECITFGEYLDPKNNHPCVVFCCPPVLIIFKTPMRTRAWELTFFWFQPNESGVPGRAR